LNSRTFMAGATMSLVSSPDACTGAERMQAVRPLAEGFVGSSPTWGGTLFHKSPTLFHELHVSMVNPRLWIRTAGHSCLRGILRLETHNGNREPC